jgi:hypothetical protein
MIRPVTSRGSLRVVTGTLTLLLSAQPSQAQLLPEPQLPPREMETAARAIGDFPLGAFPRGVTPSPSPKMRRRVTTEADRFLDALADESGGRVMYANEEGGLAAAFASVLKEFRQRYVLSYQPSQATKKEWHEIQVKLKGKSGEVRARSGYFVQ